MTEAARPSGNGVSCATGHSISYRTTYVCHEHASSLSTYVQYLCGVTVFRRVRGALALLLLWQESQAAQKSTHRDLHFTPLATAPGRATLHLPFGCSLHAIDGCVLNLAAICTRAPTRAGIARAASKRALCLGASRKGRMPRASRHVHVHVHVASRKSRPASTPRKSRLASTRERLPRVGWSTRPPRAVSPQPAGQGWPGSWRRALRWPRPPCGYHTHRVGGAACTWRP